MICGRSCTSHGRMFCETPSRSRIHPFVPTSLCAQQYGILAATANQSSETNVNAEIAPSNPLDVLDKSKLLAIRVFLLQLP